MSLSEHCALKINSLFFSFSLTSDVDSRILLTATHDRKFLTITRIIGEPFMDDIKKYARYLLYTLDSYFSSLSLDFFKLFERRGLLSFAGICFAHNTIRLAVWIVTLMSDISR
ncbi:hypothetical protein PHYBLDRAFT_62118 [Phycomyces blakesleeanus NRRL 1555(-)]|uniref:Uncharacterized protein n=1 Tax=Phycomyces blakesleeanus (strain ATCC 8743b / DSM 1359 / FGSC 10004 / NBRC 33097 / NRRL 1555) TaxID=763407 RepID=A0A167R813_PHYB8|nr:hypothetical protein PHYBLDRAFT_62118 [Phycomyces blakesleeanus NRRL 1555(-)]OAD81067.1 hypothetical protein PHYBLDRAFT_62118 [Phycomyces blakesleeanus NRRL 1555(-)]|eukprot:XP_018299107.1 hypothetical protein PHYBLDRAFT_62118 [Phycomyces blakesleeanus NRRL 1555(-)]